MAKNRILSYFFILTFLSLLGLLFIFYNNYKFESTDLSLEIKQKVLKKEHQILQLIKKHYKINFKVPLIISDKLGSNRFGMAVYSSKTKKIAIYLNKKRFKESANYMIEDVLPHEYAHALMFAFGNFSNKNSGHTKAWQRICQTLEGVKCDSLLITKI